MGILVQKDEDTSELQRRISGDLRRKDRENSHDEDDSDYVENSSFVDGTRKSSKSVLFWGTLVVLAGLSLVVIFALK